MQIELDHQLVKLTSSSATVLINLSVEPVTSDFNSPELILLGQIVNKSGYSIVEPGEYELFGVHVTALETKAVKTGQADLFQIDAENITVTYQQDVTAEIDKADWENLDDSDVLIVNYANISKSFAKVINRHNPYRLIGINGEVDTAGKLAELPVKESAAKFKFQDKDFSAEEYATEHFQLTK